MSALAADAFTATLSQPRRPDGAAAEQLDVLPNIDRYNVARVLGAGGMGVVYEAYDPQLARRVALKVIRPAHGDGAARERATKRLLREARAMAQVSHPNVVSVYDAGVVDGHVFVAMERVEGQTLRAWLDEKPRPWRELLRAFLQAGEGLMAAHAVGLVHRDFKPDNVMIGRDGRVRVLDFGLARPTEAMSDAQVDAATPPLDPLQVTVTQAIAGTPLYMAPEQFLPGGSVDHRADQFAMCVAICRALCTQIDRVGVEELRAAIAQGALRLSPQGKQLPRRIEAALRRGMSPAREQRFPDTQALIAALTPTRPPVRTAWLAALALVATAALVAAVLALWFFAGRASPVAPAPTAPPPVLLPVAVPAPVVVPAPAKAIDAPADAGVAPPSRPKPAPRPKRLIRKEPVGPRPLDPDRILGL